MLRAEREGAVAVLTLDRAEKRNALSIELRHALSDELARAAADEDVRVTVIQAEGPAFCAGMDLGDFGKGAALVDSTETWALALRDHPKPLVARVDGPALGGGFVMALYCDVRVAGPGARFGFPEVERGIPGSLSAARRVLAPGLAAELCMTGRIVRAEEAVRLGLAVTEDPVERIAALPPRGPAMLKQWMRAEGDLVEIELAAFRQAVAPTGPAPAARRP